MRLLWLILLAAIAGNESLLKVIVERARETRSDTLLIVEAGRNVHSSGRDELRGVHSITKSVCALAVGALLEDGRIASLDVPMREWVPDWRSDPVKARITLRMVMNHTTGLPDVDTVPEFWNQPDSVRAASKVPLTAAPGQHFRYSNIAASLLHPVIAMASGRSVTEYVRDRLFSPLGIADFRWGKDEVGQEITSGGLELRTSDLLKLGTMLLREGRPVLRAETVRTLVDQRLLFWVDGPIFSARGWGGQYLVVYPEKRLIAIRTRDTTGMDEARRAREAFQDFRSLILQWR